MTEPVTDLAPIDFLAQFKSQQITEYDLTDFFNVVLPQINELQQVFQDLLNLRQLDVAVGDQLDIIGRIVGQARLYLLDVSAGFFGFSDVPGYIGFNDIAGGVWMNSATEGLIPINDDEYRTLIKAKIFKNQAKFTLSQIEQLAQQSFNDPGAFALEIAPLVTCVVFSRPLTDEEKELLLPANSETNQLLIPPPSGTLIDYCYIPNGQPFGFSDQPGYFGFNDIGGGTWITPVF